MTLLALTVASLGTACNKSQSSPAGAPAEPTDEVVFSAGGPAMNSAVSTKATVVDTTGAGDNFASGFLSFIMEGKSLKEASQFANCAASLAIEKIGATTGITSRALADERYADYLQELAKQD